MELKFSHVDVLVKNLKEACAYYAQILKQDLQNARLGTRWSVRYAFSGHFSISEILEDKALEAFVEAAFA